MEKVTERNGEGNREEGRRLHRGMEKVTERNGEGNREEWRR